MVALRQFLLIFGHGGSGINAYLYQAETGFYFFTGKSPACP